MSRPASESGGYVFVTFRDDASAKLRPEDWTPLNNAIDNDLAWFLGTDLYGDIERIRVTAIISLNRSTAEGNAQEDAEKEAERLENGGTDA